MANNYITVAELNYYIYRLLNDDSLLKNVRLAGEISGVSVRDSYLFFTIKDETASLPVVMFSCESLPQNGDKVILTGTPEVYSKLGKLSFKAYKIEPYGKGNLHIELEKRKKMLMEEGLFDPLYKKAIPSYPQNVCVVTSVKGAVIKDIVSTIRKYNDLINITAIDVKVQGENAENSIIEGLLAADSLGCDVIILARGGGSFEDLMAFNSEMLARVIFSLDTPIISAVGHETDFSISDFVADLRALTPTAAAEVVGFDRQAFYENIFNKLGVIRRYVTQGFESKEERIFYSIKNVSYRFSVRITEANALLNQRISRISELNKKKLEEKEKALKGNLDKLSILNPANIMKKGYFRVEKDSKSVVSVEDLKENDTFTLIADDGSLEARVIRSVK